MKYIIPEKKIISLVDEVVKHVYPKFNKQDCYVYEWDDVDVKHYEYGDDLIAFADYDTWRETIWIQNRLYDALENYLGENGLKYFLIWFKHEFGQEPQSVET